MANSSYTCCTDTRNLARPPLEIYDHLSTEVFQYSAQKERMSGVVGCAVLNQSEILGPVAFGIIPAQHLGAAALQLCRPEVSMYSVLAGVAS